MCNFLLYSEINSWLLQTWPALSNQITHNLEVLADISSNSYVSTVLPAVQIPTPYGPNTSIQTPHSYQNVANETQPAAFTPLLQ